MGSDDSPLNYCVECGEPATHGVRATPDDLFRVCEDHVRTLVVKALRLAGYGAVQVGKLDDLDKWESDFTHLDKDVRKWE